MFIKGPTFIAISFSGGGGGTLNLLFNPRFGPKRDPKGPYYSTMAARSSLIWESRINELSLGKAADCYKYGRK